MKQLPLAISSNIYATFENYYVTTLNSQVVDALRYFVVNPQESFVYLWGGESSGITHLLSSVEEFATTSMQIQYLPLKELYAYPAESITEGLEQLDLLCIDDIEVIAGNKQWETALFHLFNRFASCQKKLLVGGHCSPRQLPLVIADLQSRLQSGLTLKLSALTADEKVNAMQMRADNIGLSLPEEVANYLIQRLTRSADVLFAALDQLDKASLAEQRKLTIPFVKKVLEI